MRVLTWLAVNVIALAAAVWWMDGLSIDFDSHPTRLKKIAALVVIGAIFGIVNRYVRPLAKLLSFPAIILTLGLFLLVVNAAMLGLTAWITRHLDSTLGFHLHVAGFWTAVGGGIVIAIASWITSSVIEKVTD